MRTVLHLSDLHFGAVDEPLVRPLIDVAGELKPDLVVISGDLTQRAHKSQFRAAREFLDALPRPQLVVPGNHDVPLRNPWARFAKPLSNYRRFISPETEPVYIDDEMAVIGVNSARSLTIKSGRINADQLSRVKNQFAQVRPGLLKIIVCHHPFHLPPGFQRERVVGRALAAMGILAASGTDVVLSGHFHLGYTAHAAERYRAAGRSVLLVQSGTALSTRRRSDANSFNLLSLKPALIEVSQFRWDYSAGRFVRNVTEHFECSSDGWTTSAKEEPTSLGFSSAQRR